jgi:hypothetical protein
MKLNNVKTTITLSKNWKLLLLNAFALTTGLQLMAQSPSSPSPSESLRISLYQLNSNGTTSLVDGNLTNYDDAFSNAVIDDALKMNNFGENFGILRDATKLAIEQRRKIYATDTTFFSMWNMQRRNYRLIITTYNLEHPGLVGTFEDSHLNASTPLLLNNQNVIDFSVNTTPTSYAAGRFRIVFRNPTLQPLATNYTSFTGRLGARQVDLQWTVNNESAMREYVVERSADRINYLPVRNVQAINSAGSRTYAAMDAGYLKADNFYRIKGVGMNGEIQYSSILKISAGSRAEAISVYPNPVINRKLSIQIAASKAGKYHLSLYNSAGAMIPLSPIEVQEGQTTQQMLLPSTIAPGVYRLRITTPENASVIKSINVL